MPHTPGPWELTTKAHITTANNKVDICLTNIHLDEADANAHLIAAAPEMLAALKDSLIFIDYLCEISTLKSSSVHLLVGYQNIEEIVRKASGTRPTTANADTHAAHGAGLLTGQSGSVPTERKLS